MNGGVTEWHTASHVSFYREIVLKVEIKSS
jgi:hypothetical protein